MERVHLAVAALIAGLVAWAYPLNELLDFDLDARFARQILDGLNPYEHGVAPRPPTAWLLQMPLVWVDTVLLARLAGAAAVVSVSWLAVRLAGVSSMWLPVVTGLVSVTYLPRVAVVTGNMASIVAILTVWAWARRSGVAVGLAAGLRLYPMIYALVVRKWSAVWIVGLLGVVGLILVPDLGLSDMAANTSRHIHHSGNGSVHRVVGFWPGVGLGVVVAWRIGRVGFDQGMALAACAAVLVPSVSWASYHLVLIPAVAWALAEGRWWVLAAIPFWVADGTNLLAHSLGAATFTAALIVLANVWPTTRATTTGEFADPDRAPG